MRTMNSGCVYSMKTAASTATISAHSTTRSHGRLGWTVGKLLLAVLGMALSLNKTVFKRPRAGAAPALP